MKTFFLLILAALALFELFVISDAEFVDNLDESLNQHWESYKRIYKKVYNKYANHETLRRLIWESNLQYIRKHNLEADMGIHSYHLGMNRFGDWTHEEMKATMLGLKPLSRDATNGVQMQIPVNGLPLPTYVDWRKEGYVTPVKDQGDCGSCWSFSTTGSLEGQFKRSTGKLISLSEQQLVDCSTSFRNDGCSGGLVNQALDYVYWYGIETEAAYPYTAKDGRCKYRKSDIVGSDKTYINIKRCNETDLAYATSNFGPISVAIDASSTTFRFYSHGIYNNPNCSSTFLDHAVLVVGYGPGYWLVKNSWGAMWGDAGYIKMSRDQFNQCGIATRGLFPIVR